MRAERLTWNFVWLAVILSLASIVGLSLFHQQKSAQELELTARASLENQGALVSQLTEAATDSYVRQISQWAMIAGARRSFKQVSSHIEAIGFFALRGSEGAQLRWFEKRPPAGSQSLSLDLDTQQAAQFIGQLGRQLGFGQMVPGQPMWQLYPASHGEGAEATSKYLVLINKVRLAPASANESANASENRYALIVAWLQPQALRSLVGEFVGARTEVVLLDERARVLAHSQAELFGKDFAATEVGASLAVAESALDSLRTFRRFKAAGRDYRSMGQKVAHTNLAALMVTPAPVGMGAINFELILFACSLILASAMVAFVLARSWLNNQKEFNNEFKTVAPAAQAPEPERAVARPEVEPPAVPVPLPVMRSPWRRLCAGLAQELKAPLIAALGNLQLLLGQSLSIEARASAVAVERELRKLKRFNDHLLRQSGLSNRDVGSVNMAEIFARVLAEMEAELAQVRVMKNFSPVPVLQALPRQIEIICEELLFIALEALSTSRQPLLQIAIEPNGPSVRVRLKYNGSAPEAVSGATTEKDKATLGLGLPLIRSILKDQGAHLSLGPDENGGTELTIDFFPDTGIPRLANESHLLEEPESELAAHVSDVSHVSHVEEKLLSPLNELSGPAAKPREFKVRVRRPKLRIDH